MVMTNVFNDVFEFMQIGCRKSISFEVKLPNKEQIDLCKSLLQEEFSELIDGINDNDIEEIADGCIDLMWICIYTCYCYGIPAMNVWLEVKRANMDKFPNGNVLYNSIGKIIKPEGWRPPDIKSILKFYG